MSTLDRVITAINTTHTNVIDLHHDLIDAFDDEWRTAAIEVLDGLDGMTVHLNTVSLSADTLRHLALTSLDAAMCLARMADASTLSKSDIEAMSTDDLLRTQLAVATIDATDVDMAIPAPIRWMLIESVHGRGYDKDVISDLFTLNALRRSLSGQSRSEVDLCINQLIATLEES